MSQRNSWQPQGKPKNILAVCIILVSVTLAPHHTFTFSLKRVAFPLIAEHVRRNAGVSLSPSLAAYPCLYLSNFYSSPRAKPGEASATLKRVLGCIDRPVLLWCEPILGSDPRSVTTKNAWMTPDQRYAALCEFYRLKFGLTYSIAIDCTLKTELSGHGRRWSHADRALMWGLFQEGA